MKHEDEEFEKLLGEIPHITDNSLHVGDAASTPCTVKDKQCGGCHHSPSHIGLIATKIGNDKLSSRSEDFNQHQPLADKEVEGPLESLGFKESRTDELATDSLTTAFSKVNLEMNGSHIHSLQTLEDDTNSKVISESDSSVNGVINASMGLYKHLGGASSISMNIGSPKGAASVGSTGSNTGMMLNREHVGTQNPGTHSLSGSLAHGIYNPSTSSNIGHAYINNAHGVVYAYTNGLGLAPARNAVNSSGRGHFNPSLYSRDGIEYQRLVNGNGLSGHVNEMDPSVHNGHSIAQDIGPKKYIYGTQMADRCQQLSGAFYDMQFIAGAPANYVHSVRVDQDVKQDFLMPSLFQAQKLCKMQLTWQRKEEERQRMQQILDSHSQALGCMQQYPNPLQTHTYSIPSYYAGREQSYRPIQTGTVGTLDWRSHLCAGNATRIASQDTNNTDDNRCTFFTQGYCSKGEICPVIHSYSKGTSRNKTTKLSSAPSNSSLGQEKWPTFPVKILSREHSNPITAFSAPFTSDITKESASNRNTNGEVSTKGIQLLSAKTEKSHFRGTPIESPGNDVMKAFGGQQSPQVKYNSLADVEGHIYAVAKDQHGCRFLQRQFDEGGPEEVEKIFSEIIDHVLELMTDPFGNYLIQKLLDVCNEDQRLKILNKTTNNGDLINVSLNMHGTRAVQKLIETLTSSEQVAMVISSLKSGVVALIKDLNGNHVIQRCLQHLKSDDSQFIFEAVTSNCVEIATHRHGCCVLQRCIDFSTGVPQQRLIAEIATNSLLLSQDPFGNYVVQYVLDLGMSWATKMVMEQLAGNYAHLSMQKFSSNVVERCLKIADEDQRTQIVHELMEDSRLLELLQDPFANYVIQSALVVSKGSLHASLVEAICPHTPFLRSSPYGKRILSRRNMKKC